ncbi:MAG TPA: ADOP family duplicated permease [Vicinamibacterales bacterium]|nr:ADOP family duplicated permease [Vicinamibacterales bacterium]
MSLTPLDEYLTALAKELRARGVSATEIVDEARGHLQDAIERGIRSGVPADVAERRALARFGTPSVVAAAYVRPAPRRPFDALSAAWDVTTAECRTAIRSLRSTPVFTAATLLTLALGIAASAAVFSVAYGVLWRPLPYRDAGHLAVIEATRDYSGRSQPVPVQFSLSSVDAFRAAPDVYQSVAMVAPASATVVDDVGSRRVPIARVTDNFFDVIGGHLLQGRPLRAGDERAVVVSARFWRNALHGVDDVIGRSLLVDTTPNTIVGVTDATFQTPSAQTDIWRLAVPSNTPSLQERGVGAFLPVVRLQPNATIAEATGEAQAAVDRLMHDYPMRYEHMHASARSLRDLVVGPARPALLVVLAAAVLLLAVACADVAVLFLVRRTARARDMAVRAALGASRRRLTVYATIEAGIVALAGTTAGLVLSAGLVRALVALAPANVPRLDVVHVDWPTAAFAGAVGAVATMAIGFLAAARQDRATYVLKSGASANDSPAADRGRSLLVIAEFALVTILLVGATLFGRSLIRLLHTDIGVSTDRVAAARIDLPTVDSASSDRQIATLQQIIARVGGLPTVLDVAATSSLPPNVAGPQYTMTRIDEAVGHPTDYLVDAVTVTPRWFDVLRVPLVAGRIFTDADDAQHPAVMIMSRETARNLFGAGDPIGRTMTLPTTGPSRHETVTLVGIIANIKYAGLDAAPNGAIYRPFAQQPWPSVFVMARTSGDPTEVASMMRPTIASVDRRIDVSQASTLAANVSADAAPPRFRALLVAAFAALATTMAGVGLYGVTAYALSRRTAEMGIRIALGATRRAIVTMAVSQVLRLAFAGVAIGMAAGYALSRTIETLLFGIPPADWVSFSAAGVILLAVSVAAALGPARRASRVDPVVALRAD